MLPRADFIDLDWLVSGGTEDGDGSRAAEADVARRWAEAGNDATWLPDAVDGSVDDAWGVWGRAGPVSAAGAAGGSTVQPDGSAGSDWLDSTALSARADLGWTVADAPGVTGIGAGTFARSFAPAVDALDDAFSSWSMDSVTGLDAGAASGRDAAESLGFGLSTTGSSIPVFTVGEFSGIDPTGESVLAPLTASSAPLINLDDFRADLRFNGVDGSGYASVILDTGIDLNHSFFGPDSNADGIADRIVYQYDFANGDGDASDVHGHGSNVASIVGSGDSTWTGVAPGVDIIALKVFTDSGTGLFSYIENALQWVVANAATYNITSVNMSLGDSGNYSTPVQLYGIADEMAALAAQGVIVVSASGNSFYNFNSVQGVSYPAADPNSLSVGAVYDGNTGGWSYGSGAVAYSTTAGAITPFSQRDDQLTDIFAPGAPITGANYNGGTVTMHGTSQASPHIAGVAVLAQDLAMEVLGRKLTVTEFTDLMRSTATTIVDGDDENDNVANTGLSFPMVDMQALGEAILAMGAPPTPTLSIAALDAAKAEGDSGSNAFTFTVTRGGDASGTTTADYAVTGTGANAASASDFVGAVLPSGTVTFSAGETSKTITVQVAGDTGVEADEGFTVTLSNVSFGAELGTATSTGTIQNDDVAPVFSIAALEAAKAEGDSGSTGHTFTVTRTGGTVGAATVDFDVTGSPAGAYSGTLAHKSASVTGYHQHYFQFATDTMSVGTGDTLFVYVRLDPSDPPTEIMVHWRDAGGWENRAYWGANELPIGVDGTEARHYMGPLPTAGEWVRLEVPASAVGLEGQTVHGMGFILNNGSALWDAAGVSSGGVDQVWFDDAVPAGAELRTANEPWDWVSGASADGADFVGATLPTGTVSFAAGETSKTLTVQVAGDGTAEEDEGFTVTLDNPSGGGSILTATAQGIIENDDEAAPSGTPAQLSIAALDAAKAEGNAGGSDFTFTVTRTGDTTGTTTADYAVTGSGGNAAAASDFAGGVLPSGTVTFADGETSKTVTLQVAGDTVFESDESFTVTLSNPSSGATIDAAAASGTIQNDDVAPTLAIAALDASKVEGDSGSSAFTFTVTRSGDSSGSTTVSYAVTGSGTNAASASDFAGSVLPSGSVTFSTGETSKTITVQVAGDTAVESDEGFTVTLSNPSGSATIATAAASGAIQNDDSAPTLSIAALDATKAEGDSGSTPFTFTVSRSGDIAGTSTVDYVVTGSGVNAAAASDFAGGGLPSGTVTFAAGETAKTVTIQVSGDTSVEADERFDVTLTNASSGAAIGTASASGTIQNDDVGASTFSIAALDSTKAEGSGGSTDYTFTVTRAGVTSGAATVDFDVTGSPADAFSGTLAHKSASVTGYHQHYFQFATDTMSVGTGDTLFVYVRLDPSDPPTEIMVHWRDAGGWENRAYWGANELPIGVDGTEARHYMGPLPTAGEWVRLEVPASAVGLEGQTVHGMGFILNNGSALWDAAGVSSGGVDQVWFDDAVPAGAELRTANEPWDWVSGDSADAADFTGGTLPSGTVTFAAGETSKTVTIQVAGDGSEENNEGFNVTLSNPSVGGSIATPTAKGLIENDDAGGSAAPEVSIAALSAAKAEGNSGSTAFAFAITRTGDTSGATTVDYAVTGSGGNAADASDFAGGILPSGTISFAAGESSKTLTVQVAGDAAVESDDGFTVTLSNPSGSATIGTSTASGTIQNDDVVPTLVIAALDAAKAEGDAGSTAYTFAVTRSGDTSGTTTADYAISGVGPNAASASDFVGGVLPSGTVTFAAGETSKTITVQIAGDTTVETNEGFSTTLLNPSGSAVIATATASGTIQNDDIAPVFSIAALDATKAEGDSGATNYTFTVSRTGGTAGAETVDFDVTGNPVGPYSGTLAHKSASVTGYHQHYFQFATDTMSVGTGDTLFVYVRLDPSDPPTEIMVHWRDAGGWENRAYWGANELPIGVDGTEARHYMGPLPTAGEWVRLEVPASAVGLEGQTVHGMGFILNNGSALWDAAGVSSGGVDQVWFDDAVPAGAELRTANEPWDWVSGASADGADFVGATLPTGTVSFAAGETSKTLTVQVAGDGTAEEDEGFNVTLSNPSNGGSITTGSASGVIENDDPGAGSAEAGSDILAEALLDSDAPSGDAFLTPTAGADTGGTDSDPGPSEGSVIGASEMGWDVFDSESSGTTAHLI